MPACPGLSIMHRVSPLAVIMLMFWLANVAEAALQGDIRDYQCPLFTHPLYGGMSSARFIVRNVKDRRQIVLWTSAETAGTSDVFFQSTAPSGGGLVASVNSNNCTHFFSEIDGGVVPAASVSASCAEGVMMCTTPFSIRAGDEIAVLYGRSSFTESALKECGFVASGVITTKSRLDFQVRTATVTLKTLDLAPVGPDQILLVGNATDVTVRPEVTQTLLKIVKKNSSELSLNNSVQCTFPNVMSYSLENVPVDSSMEKRAWAESFIHSRCYGFNSFVSIQDTCDADSECLGYTSYYYATESSCSEVPFCLLYAGDGQADHSFNVDAPDRIFALKRSKSQRTCVASADTSGKFSVWVLQNFMESGVGVDVYVDSVFVGKCPPLANTLRPLKSQCSIYSLCLTGRHYKASRIEAVISAKIAQGGCSVGAAVIIRQDGVDASQTEQTTTVFRSATLLSGTIGTNIASQRLKVSGHGGVTHQRIPIFVGRVSKIVLNVSQSSFQACPVNASTLCTPPPTVALTVGTTTVACGGAVGFFNSSVGRQDQCDLLLPCGGVIDMSSTVEQSFTGFVYVDVAGLVDDDTASCLAFAAELTVAAADGFQGPTFGFLLGSSRASFHPVVGKLLRSTFMPFTDTVARSEIFFNVIANASDFAHFFGTAVTVFNNFAWMSFNHSVDIMKIGRQMVLPVTQACLMDQVAFGGTCLHAAPPSSNFVTVSVLQSFTGSVDVFFWAGDVLLDSVRCVQKDSSLAGTLLGCTMKVCYARFVPTSASGLFDSVTVDSNAGTKTSPICNLSMAVVVEFEQRPNVQVPSCSEDEFLCVVDRKCIPTTSLCDISQDCSDNQDESVCLNWFTVENERCLNTSIAGATSSSIQATALLCQFQAIRLYRLGKSAVESFSFNPATSSCIVTINGSIPMSLQACNGSSVYFHLKDGASSYKGCSDIGRCNGKGVATLTTEGECICDCLADYGGQSCDVHQSPAATSGALAVHILIGDLNDTPFIDVDNIETLLRLNSISGSTVRCGALEEESNVSVVILCSPANEDDAISLRGLNGNVPVPFTVEQLSSTTYSPVHDCVQLGVIGQTVGVRCGASTSPSGRAARTLSTEGDDHENGRWIRITSVANVRPDGIVTAVLSDNVTTTQSCRSVATIRSDGCTVSTCIIRPHGSSTSISFSLLDVTIQYPPGTDMSNDCISNVEVASFKNVQIPVLRGDSQSFSNSAFFGFVIGAAFLFAISVYLVWRAVMTHISDSEAEYRRETVAETSLSNIIRTLRLIFLRPSAENGGFVDKGRLSVIYVIIGYNIVIIGALLLLLYLTKKATTTDSFAVLVEAYSAIECAMPSYSLSYIPIIVMTAVSSENACAVPVTAGETPTPIFLKAQCFQRGSDTTIAYRIGLSNQDCALSELRIVTNGTCVSILGAHLRFMCDAKSVVDKRFRFFENLFGSETAVSRTTFGASRITPSPLPRYLQMSSENGLYKRPFLGSEHPSTSYVPNRLAAVANADYFFPSRPAFSSSLVYQDLFTAAPVYSPTEQFPTPEIAEAENDVKSIPPNRGVLDPLLPRTADLPVGYVMNFFNSSILSKFQLLTPLESPPESLVYLNIRRSIFDIGNSFGPGTEADGVGFTISCYLRALPSSNGFVFAATDAIVAKNGRGTSPILSLLQDIIVKGLDDAVWYNSTFNVYYALYLNGPGRMLTFALATPEDQLVVNNDKKRVVQVSWDLTQLGVTLTNGQWQHIAIVLRNDYGQVKAQLIVNGRSSQVLEGWNGCLSRRPKPVQDVDALSVWSRSPLSEALYHGGMITVGAFVGSIAQLEFRNRIITPSVLTKEGTQFMRNNVDSKRSDVLSLAIALFVIVAVLILLTILSSGLAIMDGEQANEDDFLESVVASYIDIVSSVVVDEKTNLKYQRIGYMQAARWLTFTHEQMKLFLYEMKQNSGSPHRELIRVLSLVRKSQLEKAPKHRYAPLPNVADWEELLILDAIAFTRELAPPPSWFEWNPKVEDKLFPEEEEMRQLVLIIEIDQSRRRGADDGNDTEAEVHYDNMRSSGVHVDVGGGLGKSRAGGGGDTTSSGGGASTSRITTEIYNMLLPLITSLQTVYVWMSSVSFAGGYVETFGKFFSTLSIDIANLTRALSVYATPLMQLLIGLSVAALLTYLSVHDNETFELYLARYTYRRDQRQLALSMKPTKAKRKSVVELLKKLEIASDSGIEKPVPLKGTLFAKSLLHCEVIAQIPNIYGRPPECHYRYALSALSIQASQDIDEFCGVHDESDDEDITDPSIKTHDCDDNHFSISREPPPGAVRDAKDRKTSNPASETWVIDNAKPCAPFIEVVGCYCRHHPNRLLSGQMQSPIWPFQKPPTCCVHINGGPCGQYCGMMFICGAIHLNSDNELATCDYAVCERHCRFGLKDLLVSQLVGFTRLARERGVRWIMAALLIITANAIYMPFMKTALMILACHPYYQCSFKCWTNPDQLFVAAAFLAIVVVLVLGMGLPLLQAWLLRRRKSHFHTIFFSEEYHGLYTDKVETAQILSEGLTFKKVLNAFITGQGIRFLWTRGKVLLNDFLDAAAAIASSDSKTEDLGMQEAGETSAPAKATRKEEEEEPVVDLEEWSRFLSCDPSALAVLYNTLELNYMYMTPFLLIFKVILIAPIVFLEPGSFQQRVAMAVVEIAYASLIFFTAPFTSPIVDAMYRLASIHQLLLLGMQSLDTVYKDDGSGDLTVAMMLTSLTYMAVCAGCIMWTTVYPAVRHIRDVEKSHKMLSAIGLHFSQTTTLYVSPILECGERYMRKPEDGADRDVTNASDTGMAEPEQQQGETPMHFPGEGKDHHEQHPCEPSPKPLEM